MRHQNINWHRCYLKVGQITPVYPHTGKPYIGKVQKITKNKYKRISYVINDKNVFTEELFPSADQQKLRINYQKWIKSI